MKQDSSCCLVMNLTTKSASLGGLGGEHVLWSLPGLEASLDFTQKGVVLR